MNAETNPEVCVMCRNITNRCLGCVKGSHIRIDASSFPSRKMGAWEIWAVRLIIVTGIYLCYLTGTP